MKKAVWLVLVVPVVFLSLSTAQENAPTPRVDSFLELVTSELVRVGDHIGLYRIEDMGGYDVMLCSDKQIEEAQEYYANPQEGIKKQREMIKEMLPVGYPSELIFRGWVLVRGTYGIE